MDDLFNSITCCKDAWKEKCKVNVVTKTYGKQLQKSIVQKDINNRIDATTVKCEVNVALLDDSDIYFVYVSIYDNKPVHLLSTVILDANGRIR